MEILTMIGVQKCQFSAKSENWTITYANCSSKLIVNNEWLEYILSLDFPIIIHIKKLYVSIFHKYHQRQCKFRRQWSYLFIVDSISPTRKTFFCIESSPQKFQACKIRSLLSALNRWTGRDLYRATSIVTTLTFVGFCSPKSRLI